MEQEIEIDVMIADASHEVYVDTILDTSLPLKSGARVSPNVRTSMWPRR